MLFKDVEIGAVFFDNTTGEYYKKLGETDSVVWDMAEHQVFRYPHPLYKELQTNNAAFPQDHEVEEPQ
tara:strand:- start:19460 stop:19663 length:204 start_codon:yes stop_codon:yes gene_type:complete